MDGIYLAPQDLERIGRLAGWAPGKYMGKCHECGQDMIADKRAINCFICAIESLKRQADAATLTERERCIEIVNKANWAASSEAIIARIKSD